jgi:hypothetical protein
MKSFSRPLELQVKDFKLALENFMESLTQLSEFSQVKTGNTELQTMKSAFHTLVTKHGSAVPIEEMKNCLDLKFHEQLLFFVSEGKNLESLL